MAAFGFWIDGKMTHSASRANLSSDAIVGGSVPSQPRNAAGFQDAIKVRRTSIRIPLREEFGVGFLVSEGHESIHQSIKDEGISV